MKKGQSICDFMIEFGWALLVVLVIVAVLAYFGFFYSPPPFEPDCQCDGCRLQFTDNEEEQTNAISCCYESYYNEELEKCVRKYQVATINATERWVS